MELLLDCFSDEVVHSEQNRAIQTDRISPKIVFNFPYPPIQLLLYKLVCIIYAGQRAERPFVAHCFHLASAAFFAIIFRLRGESDSARAFPPLEAPSIDNATAAGFFRRSGSHRTREPSSHFSPMRSSTADRPRRLGSLGLVLLARESIFFCCTLVCSKTRQEVKGPFLVASSRYYRACSCRHGTIVAQENACSTELSS